MPELKSTKYGEWTIVEKLIKNKKLLKQLHGISCTKKEATDILKHLSEKYFNDRDFLMISWDNNSKCDRGGTWQTDDDKTMPFVEFGTITKKQAESRNIKVYGLRIGIVLHEFSHALAQMKYVYGCGHGKIFTKTFDSVMEYYKENLQKI